MQIAGYLKTSLIEWPGKIASVIFTPGCNFRCPFCHNRDLVRCKDAKRQSFKEEEVFADLASRKKWIDAVVITGGEPTLQTSLSGFLSRVKRMGYSTMIHTNGTKPEVISELAISKLVDYFCLDLKGDLGNYKKYIGIQKSKGKSQNYKAKVKTSIELVIKSGLEYEFRTTVVPGLHTEKNLISLANEINGVFRNLKLEIRNCRWYLQQFRPMNTLDKRYLKVKPFSREKVESFQNSLKKIIPQVFLRGI